MNTTITFSAGDETAPIIVTTTEDNVDEVVERFTARLSDPSEGLTIGDADTATVDIIDDDGKK